MTIQEAIKERHSVRRYKSQPLTLEVKNALDAKIKECNQKSNLNIQLITDEKEAFQGTMAKYGKFEGVENYIVLAGKKKPDASEVCGYYGEELVLFAQTLGLNTCWVAMTFNKSKARYTLEEGEKLYIVISLGYGETNGAKRKSKAVQDVCKVEGDTPSWFLEGVNAALLAPTAMNQQKFSIDLKDGKVAVKAGLGFYAKLDLGIIKYHFEVGAGADQFTWAK